jgi:hypothetical protein
LSSASASPTASRLIGSSAETPLARGLADFARRGRQVKLAADPSSPEDTMKTSKTLCRSAVRVALGVAFILSSPSASPRPSSGRPMMHPASCS